MQRLHEVTSCQIGERYGIGYFTCSQFRNKFRYGYFKNYLYPSWVQVQKKQKEDFSSWTNRPQVVQKKYSQVGNILEPYFVLSQIGKQGKPVQVYKFASSVNRALFTTFAHAPVGAASPIPFEHHLAMMATRSFWTLLQLSLLDSLTTSGSYIFANYFDASCVEVENCQGSIYL